MIWRWRLKSPAMITFSPSKSQSFAALRHLASPIKGPTNSNPQESLPSKSFRDREQLGQTPKNTFLSPQIVLATLQNCSSDIIALSFFLWCARQPHYFHDKPTFHHMVSVVSNLTHRYGNVKRILDELETVGCVRKPQTLLLLMRIYWCGAMYDMVLEAFEEMRNYGYIPNTYARNIIMDVLFKIRHVEGALRVLEETQAPNFLSFNIAICNLCRLNDVNNVKGVLRSMLIKGYYMNPETYTLVMNCFCKFARLEEALQLLGMMMVLGLHVSVNVWSILIDGFCKSGQIEVAAYFLEKMVKIGCSPNIVTCTSLIKGFWNPGCLGRHLKSLHSRITRIQYVLLPLLTSGLAIQPDLVVCNCLLSYFHKAGYPNGAVKFYNDMIDRGFLPDKYSFAGVLSALCRLGRTNEAFNVYQGIIRSYPGADAHIHTIMINELIKSGSFHKATRLFRKAAAEKLPLDVVNRNINMVKHLLQEMVDGNIEMDYHTYKIVKNLPCDSAYSLLLELRNLGLLPKVAQESLAYQHDTGACTSFSSLNDTEDVLDFGTSSSDDLSDAVVSVG
ncbi:UNVERIFIED_CONTAM: putative pentatricopeptide repeat-containing protein [Sesamum radiatum]|uniref:Pentatricopeptide repeat-containing protein n=1 Tax=Sesamum radiatum TaxID=300843 RepID=A0AAW2WHC7_SESRA